jgi:hypothetical protein
MVVAHQLAVLALRPLLGALGDKYKGQLVGGAGDAAMNYVRSRFADPSQKLGNALRTARDRAWQALEIALAGDSWWQRCQVLFSSGDTRAFRRQVRAFLDASPLAGLPGQGPEFRDECLRELRAARQAGLLAGERLDGNQLAGQAAAFARFADPESLVEAEWQAVRQMRGELQHAGFPSLGHFVGLPPAAGCPLLVTAVR